MTDAIRQKITDRMYILRDNVCPEGGNTRRKRWVGLTSKKVMASFLSGCTTGATLQFVVFNGSLTEALNTEW